MLSQFLACTAFKLSRGKLCEDISATAHAGLCGVKVGCEELGVTHAVAEGYQTEDESPEEKALLAALRAVVACSLPSIHDLIIWI